MANWTKLAALTIEAEIPQYELLQSIASFFDDLKANRCGDETLSRIATFFQLPREPWFISLKTLQPCHPHPSLP